MAAKQPRFRGAPLKREFVRNLGGIPEKPAGLLHITWPNRLTHIDRFIAREFLRHLPAGAEIDFLDAGCKPGKKGAYTTQQSVKNFQRFGKVRVNAIGSDYSVPAHLLERVHRGIVYRKEDLTLPPREKELRKYDVIRVANVLMHADEDEGYFILQNAANRLRIGGLMIINGAGGEPMQIIQKISRDTLKGIALLPPSKPVKNWPKTGDASLDAAIARRKDETDRYARDRLREYAKSKATFEELRSQRSQLGSARALFLRTHAAAKVSRPIQLPAPK